MTLRTPHLNALIVTLAAAYGAIALSFGAASFLSSHTDPVATARTAEAVAVLSAPPSAPVDVSPLKTRPLFSISRRPKSMDVATETPAEAVPQATGFEDFHIIAVATKGTDSLATLESTSGERVRLKIGSDLRGWKVKSIDHEGITLQSGGDEKRIEFPKATELVPGEPIRVGDGAEQPQPATP